MDLYLGVKLLHILSATLLLGTGLGTAFFMLLAYRSDDSAVFAGATRIVVLADWIFTAPAVVLQVVTGLWLTMRLGIRFDSIWFMLVMGLFILVGMCWLPVVGIQIRIRDHLRENSNIDECRGLMRAWIGLGIPAFTSVIVLFALMVYKPWIAETF